MKKTDDPQKRRKIEEDIEKNKSPAKEKADSPKNTGPTRRSQGGVTCCHFGCNRYKKYPLHFFCDPCSLWDTETPRDGRMKRTPCEAGHDSFIFPSTLKESFMSTVYLPSKPMPQVNCRLLGLFDDIAADDDDDDDDDDDGDDDDDDGEGGGQDISGGMTIENWQQYLEEGDSADVDDSNLEGTNPVETPEQLALADSQAENEQLRKELDMKESMLKEQVYATQRLQLQYDSNVRGAVARSATRTPLSGVDSTSATQEPPGSTPTFPGRQRDKSENQRFLQEVTSAVNGVITSDSSFKKWKPKRVGKQLSIWCFEYAGGMLVEPIVMKAKSWLRKNSFTKNIAKTL